MELDWNSASNMPRTVGASPLQSLSGRLEALNALAASHRDQIIVHALDVGNHAQIEKLAQSLSGESLDLLINNAGIYTASHGRYFRQYRS